MREAIDSIMARFISEGGFYQRDNGTFNPVATAWATLALITDPNINEMIHNISEETCFNPMPRRPHSHFKWSSKFILANLSRGTQLEESRRIRSRDRKGFRIYVIDFGKTLE